MKRAHRLVPKLMAIAIGVASGAASAAPLQVQLSGWSAIPSEFLQPGPVSGQFASGSNGVTPPYAGQPIPGFSGIITTKTQGQFIGLPDNGFGAQGNSADFVLGFYHITPTFKSTGDGTSTPGNTAVNSFTPFSDPDGRLTADFIANGPVYNRTNYYPTGPQIPVDPSIRNGHLLTGADFDVESIVQLNDGSFYVGEEFGPYLLHFGADGKLLSDPIRHPTLRAPQNPQNTTTDPSNLPSSRGFESMARNADGSKLYVTTEASISSELDKRVLEIFEFDTATASYTDTVFRYAKDSSDFITGATNNASNIFVTGDLTHIAGDRYVMIERDDFQGPPSSANPPQQKKLYLIDLSETDENGFLKKRLVVDLLSIFDPFDIGGPLAELADDEFSFPLQSVESVVMVDPFTLLVGLDNNYPSGNGRNPGTPDDTEIITLRFNQDLTRISVPEPSTLGMAATLFGLIAWGRRRHTKLSASQSFKV